MRIYINQKVRELGHPTHLVELLNDIQPKKPFAIAVNNLFIPKDDYDNTLLHEEDHIEIISPVTGG
ncbi:MAG: sulfur carrier protein ThiS [Betaproteobacteria bacterium]|jgi:sulfur carrier protein